MRMYSNMVLLTLEQVTKIYGFTDKNKAKPHNRRTESARRASRDVLSWRRCDRHRQAAYWHCTIKCTRKKKIQCKTTTSQPIWLQSRSTAAASSRASVFTSAGRRSSSSSWPLCGIRRQEPVEGQPSADTLSGHLRRRRHPFVLECKGHWVTSRSRSACIFPTSMPTCCRPMFTPVCMPA